MADLKKTTAPAQETEAPVDAFKGAEIMEKYEKESRTRKFESDWMKKLVYILCLAFTIYHLAYASGLRALQMVNIKHHAIHVGLILVLGFLLYPAFKKTSRKKMVWYDWICVILSAIMPVYVFLRYPTFISTGFQGETIDIIMGTILILLVLECSRRISGPALTILSIIFLAYGVFGRSFPGVFMHRGYTWHRIVTYLTTDIYGIYGTSVKVAATYIVLFIIFGEVMNKCGMGQFFNDIANALAGHTKGGPAKVAVLASGFLGSINGSAVANVVTTGTFTIPLMKKTGYQSEFAAATEAAASTGGQIMPPIMGAAAFLMAEYVQEPYSRIVLRAILPAVLYFTGIFISVHLEAKKLVLEGLKKEDLPKVLPLLKKSYLLFPLFLLIYLVVTSSRSIQYAAAISIVACIVVSMFNKDSRITPKRLLEALAAGGQGTITVAAACGIAGIIAGTITMTGLASNIISGVVALAGGSVFLALLLTMVCCIVLGMGVPTTATYCIMAATCAPILVQMGVPTVAAHFFVFYFGIVADLTPPVALAAYAGAAIAKASPMKTAVTATKLAIGAFIVPYAFAMSPAMLLIDTNVLEVILICITAFIGICCISASLEGYLLEHMPWYERLLCLVGGLMLILPGTVTDLGGIALAVIVVALQFVARRRAPAAA